jgi:hypothetical protein
MYKILMDFTTSTVSFMTMTRIFSFIILQYGLAEDTMRSGKPDVSPNELYSQSAIYVAAAHALKPNYSVSIYVSVTFSTICLGPF